MSYINEKAPMSGGSQTSEANSELQLINTVYSIEDEISNASSTEEARDIAEEYIDRQNRIDSLSEELKTQIDSAQTASEAALLCIEHVVEAHNSSHSSDQTASYDELQSYEAKVLELYQNAVLYHNTNPNNVNWKLPEKLTKAQTEALLDEIPVKSDNNYSEVLQEVTSERISEYLKNHPDITPLVSTNPHLNDRKDRHIKVLVDDIIRAVNERIKDHNRNDKFCKWSPLRELAIPQIVDIIAAIYPVITVEVCKAFDITDECLLLGVYINDPTDKFYGIYSSDLSIFQRIIRNLRYGIKNADIEEIITQLKSQLPIRTRENDRDLIAVGNGIFNYRTKVLEPFSPERVFLSKSPVNYVENPENPVLRYLPDGTDTGEDWDIETWMQSLSDDPEIVFLLWKIIGAIIRPNNRWNTSAWLYAETGNNGKGTLCELMRNVCGNGGYSALSLTDFGKDFMLEPLLHSSAVIADENDVGIFIDRVGNLKSVITNDDVIINRKFKKPITFQFRGFVVQCLNEYPRVKDKSESFYRRQLFIPMTKCFTGREKKYIKEFYLHDPKVLEYVLNKVLTMDNYYTLEAPAACRELLDEYKTFNDPVRMFFNEIRAEIKWDRIPFDLLYDLYKGWMKENNPNGIAIANAYFRQEIKNIINTDPVWGLPDNKQKNFRCTDAMRTTPEPLLDKYHAYNWIDDRSQAYYNLSRDGKPIARLPEKPVYGIIRRGVDNTAGENESE